MSDTRDVAHAPSGDPSEHLFEETVIERLEQQGYVHHRGALLRETTDFPEAVVIHEATLRGVLQERYPHLDELALTLAVKRISNPDGVDLSQRNKHFHKLLTRGFDVPYERDDGTEAHEHVYVVDWEEPTRNTFWVVSQLTIAGQHRRRPDLIVYVNGLPLVVFELKNPYDEHPTVHDAYNQLQHYQLDVPQLFDVNAFCVLSDGTETLHGVHSASMEWFSPWKSIDGETVEQAATGSMKTLIEGLFPPQRLLQYMRHFIVHEESGEGIVKKGARYHQYFGVRFAVENAERAIQPEGDRKIGVIWHTQGSGKSLSMVFFVGILRQHLGNPSIVVQVDRNDLDEQLYDSFVAAKALVGTVHHADSVDELRALLKTEGGEVIFTTIEKFRLQEDELEHPVLSERRNIIVMADEAHRTQYGFKGEIREHETTGARYTAYGFAQYLRQALPNASFIGFTGTPIEEDDRDTVAVFGEVIHTYDLTQAQADKAIVPIYYEARLIDLQLINEQLDDELEEIVDDEDVSRELLKWTTLEAAAGAKERLEVLAEDIVAHYEARTETLFGKAMIVCMSRRICVALFDEIVKRRPDWYAADLDQGAIKVVMTGSVSKDPPAWNEAGHITTKGQRDRLKQRFRDPEDALKLVIVCDMWLTGTDIPCLHTLYVDKPMRGHNLMQAIARVNRVFEDKPAGLIVDYIGISTQLKKATRRYTTKAFGTPAEELEETAAEQFERALEAIRETLPGGVDVRGWRDLSRIAFEDLCSTLYGHYLTTDDRRDDFLVREKRLSSAFSLMGHLDLGQQHADEVAFYQLIRAQLVKTQQRSARAESEERRRAVRDLIDRSIGAQDAVDLFEAAGLEKPDLSILDEQFLEEFRSQEQASLRVRLLEKLMHDEIRLRKRTNLAKYGSFEERLKKLLERYRRGAITAAEVIQAMVEIRQEMITDDRRKEQYDLDDEELAFLDAIEGLGEGAYDMPFLCDLIREVVQAVKNNLKVDWTKPHRENVKTGVRAAIKMVLRRRKVKREHFQFILRRVMEQAEEMYRDWPQVA